MNFHLRTKERYNLNLFWMKLFNLFTIFSVITLLILLLNIINGAFGYVIIQSTVPYDDITGDAAVQIEDLDEAVLIGKLEEFLSRGMIRKLNHDNPLEERAKNDLVQLVYEQIVEPRVQQSWNLRNSIVNRQEIRDFAAREYPDGIIEFRSWLNLDFLVTPQASVPSLAGIRTAIAGSMWVIMITIIFSFPIGLATAIYLEEYANKSRIWNKVIELNIYNLSGVPSIVYGLLGLTLFVRYLEPITSGRIFGIFTGSSENGRTILSAGLTLGLLILPIIIISSQEAIRAVPESLRHGSYGLGASKWQTIRRIVIPTCFDRILTGTIIAVSRALGETAPIVVIGASTFITMDPQNIFSKFTTLPIQIYQWTARPQAEFRNVAAAAIIVLLALLMGLNSTAIIMRNKISKNQIRM